MYDFCVAFTFSTFLGAFFGIAKDKLGLRPGVMAETDDVFAIASEEVSLREVVDTQNIEQISPGEVMVYEI